MGATVGRLGATQLRRNSGTDRYLVNWDSYVTTTVCDPNDSYQQWSITY
ncbi:hypothetical protein ACIBM4_05710 [Streptomyces sp. NPDC050256]